ncbi:MAG: excinuclease ABC subunit UvrC [Clostridia bacterium]|nr:excinuclease ABC subunit UvrC [Clostridia bacterium]
MEEYHPQILTPEKLLEKAKALPHLPGVYLFYDRNGKIVYVGKSKHLRDRVLSYLQNAGRHPPKTERLVQTAVDFQTIVTASESEALLLENEKIKLHQPKFNIRLKDDKNYPYVKLSYGDPYPRVSIVRRREKKDHRSKYFGPYGSGRSVRDIVDMTDRLFALPTCSRVVPRDIGKERPCLFYHLGRCCGVCTGKVSEEAYRERIDGAVAFLKNDFRAVRSSLEGEMNEAAEKLEFERAARLRDQIKSLSALEQSGQIVKDLNSDADVFGFFADELGGCIDMLQVRGGRVVDNAAFHFGADEILSPESFSSLLVELYHGKEFFPREILLPPELYGEESEGVVSLFPVKVRLHCPERGEGRRIVAMAAENARQATLHRRAALARDEEVLVKLASLLGLEVLPERIESIDISNSGASVISASIITVLNARFHKKDYKTFTIDLDHPDDTTSMYRAISRRLERYQRGDAAFSPLPDLFLVDGGKGQVHAVRAALYDHGLSVPVYGMVKDDFHKTRCLTDGEREISIARELQLFQFIYGIQEEVHRFSFSRMDFRRRKSVKSSTLTRIPGIGERKAAALLRHFKSIAAVKSASEEELREAKGISQRDAKAIRAYFEEIAKEPPQK